MSLESLPKAYEPAEVEAKWASHWVQDGTFKADPNAPGEAFSIVIPPPNVTGALHIGHALNHTLQDVLARHARQLGKNVLWVPGMDHAGIATQNVVERALAKEGKTRHDLGREAFIQRVWEWKEEYGGRILNQIRRMGQSVDWSRERFTMDESLARAVRKVFVQLYNDGLIYKGKYLVNWCVRCQTALSDDEVEHSTRKDHLWHIRYDLADGSGSITIATTRPETIMGDSAICVNPEDTRYTHLIGKTALVPIINRPIPIIADSYVDKEFGSGALKVTPCHDINDWNLGKTHNLAFIQVLDETGHMSAEAGPYAGLTREECRTRFLAELTEAGHLVQEEEIEHSVGHCYRCQTVIEPYASTQWFVATTKMAPQAKAAVPSEIAILPDTWEKTYYNWLDNIRDWCISRQLWWGHRIPAWTCNACGHLIVSETDPTTCPQCASSSLTQDPDVLDTWFSSALWPFSTMGWPNETEDLARYYPTSVLVTAFDILFFWVARMVMMGQHFMHKPPFHHVYIHALVRDAGGKKMSKSTGNVIDPIDMIDTYGADALRFTLVAFAAMGRDIKLSEERIEGYRHFINKLWNAARFSLMNLPDSIPSTTSALEQIPMHHAWILYRLEATKEENKAALAAYRFNDSAQLLYKFLWNEFCDWYLELIKPDMRPENPDAHARGLAQHVLYTVLKELLQLLHPIIPFVTSEIWQALPGLSTSELALEPYPTPRPHIPAAFTERAQSMAFVQDCISAIRTIRAELNIKPSATLTVDICPNPAQSMVLNSARHWFTTLARVETLNLVSSTAHAPKASASTVIDGAEIIVHLAGLVDFDAELARLAKEITKTEKDQASLAAKLATNFAERAPADVVEAERTRLQGLDDTLKKLTALQERFKSAWGG